MFKRRASQGAYTGQCQGCCLDCAYLTSCADYCWMARNERSIRGCTLADLPKPEWGRYTRNGNRLYAHVFEAPIGPLALTGLKKQDILKIRRLSDGAEMKLSDNWVTTAYGDIPFVSFGEVGNYTYPLPDPIDTVLEITLK